MRTAILALSLVAGSAFAQTRIDSLSPAQGPIAGGTIVTVRGANFSGAAVRLDRAPVTPLSQGDTEVRLQTPKHDNGYALIEVGSAAAEFLYVPPRLEDLPPGYITTIAGVGKFLRLEQPANRSMIEAAGGVALASNGDVYITQAGRGLILRIRADGVLQHVAGSLGPVDFSHVGDGGPAVDAFIGFARDVCIDASGNLYAVDTRARVRRIDGTTGIITTVAGTGVAGFSGDAGPAKQAQIEEPTHIACAPDGTLYFLDANVRVRKVTPAGIITTVAGNGTIGESGDDGPATAAQLSSFDRDHGDIAVDGDSNVFILEMEGGRVRRVDAKTGIITTFASRDSRGPFGAPRALAVDAAGNVYVATQFNIDKFSSNGQQLDQWFRGAGFSEDGTSAKDALIGSLHGMAIAANGDIFYSDATAPRVRRINLATGKIETLAGMAPQVIGVPGLATGAMLNTPDGDLAFLPSGDLLFVGGESNWMYRIDVHTGAIGFFAGTGMFSGGYEETPALSTSLSAALAIDIDRRGNVYFADKQSIRWIDTNGIVHRIAGRAGGPCEFSGDGGPARDALLCQPTDVSLDRAGNIFIADSNNNRIRRVEATTGMISTVAGSGAANGFEGYGHGTYCGDGGAATSACFDSPIATAVQDDGAMYISDFWNEPQHKVRKVAPDGTVSSLPWPLTMKLIVGPAQSILGHALTKIYRVDNDRIRILTGGSTQGFSGDGGPASQALMANGEAETAQGLAVDAEGNLFFHDAGNRRIRVIRYGAVLAPPNATVQASASGTSIRATVFDAEGHPAPGVRVELSVPSGGASCTLASSFAVTDASGAVAVQCDPNCVAGSYAVTVTPLLAPSALVALSNTGTPCRRRPAKH